MRTGFSGCRERIWQTMAYIEVKAREIPVIHEADVCVIGGSCTGVFAAVRAARLGAKVVIVEKLNSFGGVATNGRVSLWHTFMDKANRKQIIAGLTEELMERLSEVDYKYYGNHLFNPAELKCELDLLLQEENIKIYLHTVYAGVSVTGDTVDAVFVENKGGRGAIKAKFFIDASGDGDLCRDLGIERYENEHMQPPSYVFLMQGDADTQPLQRYNKFGSDIVSHMISEFGEEFDLEPDWGWAVAVPGINNAMMRANTHVFGVQCGKADDLTRAELVGREKMRKVCRMLRKYGDTDEHYSVMADAATVGIRDTYHYRTRLQANYVDLLLGRDYEDNILNGSYNIDVHSDTEGIKFMYFDGTYRCENNKGELRYGNWREELGISKDLPIPTYYRLPFRCLVGERYTNLIAAGRMINADTPSYGALRVMVNTNQMGEAAGVSAYLAIHQGKSVQELDGAEVARTLSKGGSANLG